MKSWIATLAMVTGVLGALPALARVADQSAVLYKLDGRSSYSTGCFGPCACPILTEPLRGTFLLKRTEPDPLYEHYEVSDVKWIVPRAGNDLHLMGAGTYQVGGEFAITQRLSLDLSVGGDSAVRFDSGLVPGGGSFPLIDVEISRHGEWCLDTVIHVVAAPAVAGVGDGAALFGIRRVAPNPFLGRVDVELVLPVASEVDARVYDAQGRECRTLAGGRLEAGSSSLGWDGRSSEGLELPAGLYFLRIRAEGREYRRMLVKLH